MTQDVEPDQEGGAGGAIFSHIPAILWQRRWWLIVPLILLSIAGVAAAFLLPVSYRSTATLLVQSSALPTAVAGDDTGDLIDRRIARIREQVLSRPGLIELVNKYQLYPALRKGGALSAVVDDMREAIAIVPLVSEAQQRPGGSSTIAFSLSYNYGDPVKAQAVVQDLVEQVLQLDSTSNTQQASNTVQFLSDQAVGLQEQAGQLEQQIAGIKRANGSVLSNSGMGMIGGSSGSYDVQIAALQRENAMLVSQRDLGRESATRDPIVAGAEAQLAAAQAIYSDNHPDVRLARQRLAEAKALAAKNVAKLPFAQIDQQMAFNNAQISSLRSAQAQERAQVSSTLGAQSRAPAVLEQIGQLQQKLDGLNEQYRGVSGRLLQAKAGVKAENEQLGERLSLVDPPVVPEKPTFPNRWLFSGGGVGAGLALGLVLIFAVELLRRPIRDPAMLTSFFGEAPIGVIPTIARRSASKSRWNPFTRSRRTSLG